MSRRRRRTRPQTAAELLLGQRSGLGPRLRAVQELSDAWTAVVGAGLAAQAFPIALEGDALVVGVADPIWIQELDLMAPQILRGLRDELPGFEARRLRCRHVPPQAEVRRGAPSPEAPPPPDLPADALAAIEHPALRAAFADLHAASRRHGGDDSGANDTDP